MSLISVVMPTHKAERWVEDAIQSVISQTYRDIELIVVDDASRDDTPSVARKKLNQGFKGEWRIIELETNQGPSAARNIGLKAAKGAWIQFLDSDDLIAPTKFEREIQCCSIAAPSVAAVYSPWQRFYFDRGKMVFEGPLAQPNMKGRPPIMCFAGSDRYLNGAGLVRKSVLDEIGGFDESLRFWECEEVGFRTAKAGQLMLVPSDEPLYMWRMHREKAYIGGETARYQLEAVALSWIELMVKAAEGRTIDQLGLSTGDQAEILGGCTMWARRLYSKDREAFRRFVTLTRILVPNMMPTDPSYVAFASRYVGYENAEAIALVGAKPRALARKALEILKLRTKDSVFE